MFKRTSAKLSHTEQLAKYQLMRYIAQDAVAAVEQHSLATEKTMLKKTHSVDKKEAAMRRFVSTLLYFDIVVTDPIIFDVLIEASAYDIKDHISLETFDRAQNDDT